MPYRFRTVELHGKNALVTGAARRLGREIALALADKGVNVAIHYHRSKKEAQELAQEIMASGLKSVAIRANIEKAKEITKVLRKAYEFLGGLDILVNNAGVFYTTPIDNVTDNDWSKFLDINLKAQFYFSREFASLERKAMAKIINMADSYGASPAAAFIPYGVSKAGVIALTKGLAKAYAPDILVNCICGGPISCSGRPPWQPSSRFQAGTEAGHYKSTQKSEQRAISATLLERAGRPEDITKTVLFLAENDYITGQAIFVDGGRCIP